MVQGLNLFYRVVEVLEQRIAVSAYYTVRLASFNIGKKIEDLKEKDLKSLIYAILDIYGEFYPHRVTDIKISLKSNVLKKQKKRSLRERFWSF